ncbi:MAG: methyltransferase domain-containing protein [Eubacteriales bacterium]
MQKSKYVHGYSNREAHRLADQANTLAHLLHKGTVYPAGSTILEAGCGTGSQTGTLAKSSPLARFTSIDISAESLSKAAENITAQGIQNVVFQQADIFNLPFAEESFDHVFVCFVLEHLSQPLQALASLKKVLKKGGSITLIEGDHGSAYIYPRSAAAVQAIQCQIDLQAALGGNSLIGREVYPLLREAGFRQIRVLPKMVYAEGRNATLADGFTRKTFTAMVEGVRDEAISRCLINQDTWEQGIRDLYRTAEPDGVFCYTFFKGTAIK